MATPEEFAAACKDAARNTRRLPKDLRRALGQRVRPDITDPLAARIGAGFTGPHAVVLRAGTKARTAATPDIVVGGTRPRLSGGGGPRDVIFGDEFGGGRRVTKGRRSTRQFDKRPNVFPTLARNVEWTLDRYAEIVDDVLEETI